jgi:SAM-dependent methyltransferase
MTALDHAPSLYDALAPIYDRWQRAGGMTPFSQLTLHKLLPVLGRHVPGPERSFVDIGCGTGDLLLGLARVRPRWRLAGLDGSAAMLGVARGKPGAARIQWVRDPLADPARLTPAFDAAGCFYDTLNHLTDLAQLHVAVRRIAASLTPGGLFVFDTTNELGFDRWWQGNRAWRGRDWSVVVETRYDGGRRLGRAEVTVDDRGLRTVASLTERCFSVAELEAALDSAGLASVAQERWSPFDVDAPGKTWWIRSKSTHRPPVTP